MISKRTSHSAAAQWAGCRYKTWAAPAHLCWPFELLPDPSPVGSFTRPPRLGVVISNSSRPEIIGKTHCRISHDMAPYSLITNSESKRRKGGLSVFTVLTLLMLAILAFTWVIFTYNTVKQYFHPIYGTKEMVGHDLDERPTDNIQFGGHDGIKVIAIVFYGRREYVRVLDCYLKVCTLFLESLFVRLGYCLSDDQSLYPMMHSHVCIQDFLKTPQMPMARIRVDLHRYLFFLSKDLGQFSDLI